MASGMADSPLRERPGAVAPEYQLIDQQIDRARQHVKAVDLGVAVLLLVVGVAAYLFALVLVDHWVMPLGRVGRYLAWGLLVIGCGWYVVARLLPLVLRRINPLYAARTIENSHPQLHNSLLNFLFLRSSPTPVREIVFRGVAEQAASELSQVEVDATVDHTPLIRLGYGLVAAAVVFALYLMLSPKSPLQTVARVLTPWADIQRPARVSIADVAPGDQTIYYGQSVEVTARITGVAASDRVSLLYTKSDRSEENVAVPLLPIEGAPHRFRCALPPTAGGLRQDCTYRIIAGDAETREYQLAVRSAPTITLDQAVYHYPDYAARPEETVAHPGDLRALEGTRITLRATSSHPMQSAWIEFDADQTGVAARTAKVRAAEVRPLNVLDERTATGSFVLRLRPDRKTPEFRRFQVRFLTTAGDADEPTEHAIEVVPDLAPEVQWVAPTETQIEVPLHGQFKFEVRAIDPDFGLSALRLHFARGPKDVVKLDLLPPGRPPASGQQLQAHDWSPAKFDPALKAGDQLLVWADAADNRVSPTTGRLEPNTARTTNVLVKIAADPQPQEGDKSAADKLVNPQQPQPEDPRPNQNQTGKSDKNPSDSGQQPGEKNNSRKGNDTSPSSRPGDVADPKNDRTGKAGDPNENPKSKPGEQNPLQPKQPGDTSRSPSENNSANPDQSQQPKGAANQGQDQTGEKSGDKSSEPTQRPQQPLASDGSQDSDVFREVLKHKQERDQKNHGATDRNPSPNPADQTAADKANEKPGEKASDKTGEKPGEKIGEKPGPKSPEKPNDKSGEKSGEKTGENAAVRPGDPTADKSGEKPGEKPADKTASKTGQKPGDKSSEPPGEKPGEKSGDKTAGNNVGEKTGDKTTGPPQAGEKTGPSGDPSKAGQKPQPGDKSQPGEKPAAGEKTQSGESTQSGQPPKAGEKSQGSNPAGAAGKPSETKSGAGEDKQSGENSSSAAGGEKPKSDARTSPADPSAKSLDPKTIQQMVEAAKKLQEQLKNGTPAEKAAAQKKLEEAAQALERAKDGQIKPEDLKKLAEQMEKMAADQGGKPQGGDKTKPETSAQKPHDQGPQQGGAGDNGKSGPQGNKGNDNHAAPQPMGDNVQSKNPSREGSKPQDDQRHDDQAPSVSKKQSNAEGNSDGDRSGGGGKGGGQSGKQQGNDSAGSSSPGDEGAGKAQEKGNGPDGTRGGDQKAADHKTGSSGREKGPGGSGQSTDPGERPGGSAAGKSPSAAPGSKPPVGDPSAPPGTPAGDPRGQGNARGGERPGSQLGPGGGLNPDRAANPSLPPPPSPQEEAEQLAYARKATDLVLDYLKDQKENPDPALLQKLGWTDQQLREYLDRWQKMKEAAGLKGAAGEEARQELDETLRALGLRPGDDRLRGGNETRDKQQGNRDAGRRSSPPAEYLDQYRAFLKGTARGGKE